MGLPKRLLGTIQSISVLQIPLKHRGKPFPPQNHLFSGLIFGPNRSPAQPESSGVQIWDPGSQKWSPGLKISKLRTEKPCPKQWSVFQMEPYVASYGRKPFGAGWAKSEEMCLQTKHLLCLQTRHLCGVSRQDI